MQFICRVGNAINIYFSYLLFLFLDGEIIGLISIKLLFFFSDMIES